MTEFMIFFKKTLLAFSLSRNFAPVASNTISENKLSNTPPL